MQERALRVICQYHSDTYEELLPRVDIPSLHNRRLQDITELCQTWSRTWLLVSDLFVRKGSTHSLRNSDSYYHVLELHDTANTLLDISGHSYGQN